MIEPEIFEKKISYIVENQFPAFYREEGPIFMAFVKKYYEWMESNSTIINANSLITGISVVGGNTTVRIVHETYNSGLGDDPQHWELYGLQSGSKIAPVD